MKLTKVKLLELNQDPENTRCHSDRNIKTICDSLIKFGQYRAFVVQKKGMIIRIGNGMYEAMSRLGWTEGDAVVKELTDEEATALSIIDNRSSELAEWDESLLASALDGLPDDLTELVGFNSSEIEKIIEGACPIDLIDNSDEKNNNDKDLCHCPKCGFEFGV